MIFLFWVFISTNTLLIGPTTRLPSNLALHCTLAKIHVTSSFLETYQCN